MGWMFTPDSVPSSGGNNVPHSNFHFHCFPNLMEPNPPFGSSLTTLILAGVDSGLGCVGSSPTAIVPLAAVPTLKEIHFISAVSESGCRVCVPVGRGWLFLLLYWPTLDLFG
ncbi:hypothetical protein EYF80_048724 [Liparis tanakae]|uniref:Uncharacterized protein n=1 Tax=Liparis tanakae TaxID=230148 RepID=A0A4Z2FLG2_9TELE|nr:hypothetical protein EYF80_048724 [Liparis tanakae]